MSAVEPPRRAIESLPTSDALDVRVNQRLVKVIVHPGARFRQIGPWTYSFISAGLFGPAEQPVSETHLVRVTDDQIVSDCVLYSAE